MNGHRTQRYPGNLNLSFAYVEGESLLMVRVAGVRGAPCLGPSPRPPPAPPGPPPLSQLSAVPLSLAHRCHPDPLLPLPQALKNVAVSSGSACTSASLEPSYVLRAIGVTEDLAHTSIRFGLGRFTTLEEVDFAADLCVRHVGRLREMSPLWEMVQEGVDLSKIEWTQH